MHPVTLSAAAEVGPLAADARPMHALPAAAQVGEVPRHALARVAQVGELPRHPASQAMHAVALPAAAEVGALAAHDSLSCYALAAVGALLRNGR
jgi:hypothetical protein